MKEIILASESPRRKDLLDQINLKFKIRPSNIDENTDELIGTPVEKVETLALKKAQHIAKDTKSAIIIGADTIIVLDNEIFGKPYSKQDAFCMLKQLNNTTHQVITGVAVIDTETKKTLVNHEVTHVTFSNITDKEIKLYLNTGEYEGKAGSYAIQGIGSLFVKKIDGCYFNVVGLPINKLKTMLQSFDINLL